MALIRRNAKASKKEANKWSTEGGGIDLGEPMGFGEGSDMIFKHPMTGGELIAHLTTVNGQPRYNVLF